MGLRRSGFGRVEQRPDGGAAAKRLCELRVEALEHYEPEVMLSRQADAVRVRAVIDRCSMLMLRAVLTDVFVSVLTLSATGMRHRLDGRFVVNRAITHLAENRLGHGHPVAYEKNESDKRPPTHQCNSSSRELPPVLEGNTVPS